MADILLREIDKIGELLLAAAYRLGLFKENPEGFSMKEVQNEFDRCGLDLKIDTVLESDTPLVILVEQMHLSEQSLETLCQLLYESDKDSVKVKKLISDVIGYLTTKQYFSFTLASIPLD